MIEIEAIFVHWSEAAPCSTAHTLQKSLDDDGASMEARYHVGQNIRAQLQNGEKTPAALQVATHKLIQPLSGSFREEKNEIE